MPAAKSKKKLSRNQAQTDVFALVYGKKARIKEKQNRLIAERTTLLLAAGARLVCISQQLEPIIKNSISSTMQQELRASINQYVEAVNHK